VGLVSMSPSPGGPWRRRQRKRGTV